jgi:hypothetical protein
MEHVLDVNKVNKSLENLVNEIAIYHLPGDIITLHYPAADIKMTIK